MAIATRMTHQIRSLNQAVRNSGDAISLIQTAEGATNEITDMMQRMRELAIQAVNDTNDPQQRAYLDLEFQQLKQQIVQISDNTEWNGFPVLNGKAGEQVGEMPVYKATSNNQFGDVLLNPTTTRIIEGTASGEQQTISFDTTVVPNGAVDETSTVTFAALAAGATLTVGGLTFTAGGTGATATEVAASFANRENGYVAGTGTAPTNGTFTGTLTGFSTGVAASGVLKFTSYPTGTNDPNIVFSGTGTVASVVIDQGGSGALDETASLTFSTLTAGQTLVIGGLTYTAGSSGATATQIATDFANRSNGYAGKGGIAPVSGTFSGALTGFSSGAASSGTLTFTSSSTNTDVTNLVIGGTGTAPNVVLINGGSGIDTETTAVTFKALAAGEFLTIGGLTYTAGAGGATATEVATDFASRPDGYATGGTAAAKGTFTGTLTGFSTGLAAASSITFTSSSAGANVTNLPITGTGKVQTVATTNGGNGSTNEIATFTFKDLANGQTVTIAGLTFTANAAATATEVAANFASRADGYAGVGGAAATKGTFSGVLTGYSTGANTAGALTFTSSTLATNVTNISFSGTAATLPSVVVKNGGPLVLNGAGFTGTRTFKFAGETINLQWDAIKNTAGTAVDTTKMLTQIQQQLNATDRFGTGSGRTVEISGSNLILTYAAKDGDVSNAQLVDASNDGFFKVGSVTVSRNAVTQTNERFDNNGRFMRSGNLVIERIDTNNDGILDIKAVFTTPDNKSVNLTGTFDNATGSVKFLARDGINSTVISDNLTYVLKDANGAPLDASTTAKDLNLRNFKLTIDVSGSIPSMRAGDLLINGVEIGGSFATDDPFSPINNANGSAIAKAAAINRKAAEGSGPVGESQSITFSGNPIPGVITVGGVSVQLSAMENTPALAVAKVAEAMRTSAQFGQGSGRTVSYAPGSTIINVDFPITDGQVSNIDVQERDTNLKSVTDKTRQYSSSSAGTGVFAKVNENIFTGKSMSGNSVVSGVVFVNGYASAKIDTLMNNPRDTRATVVRAINLISDKTGVVAEDTGSDQLGVTLKAADGRNIEVTFETTAIASDFGNRIGMRQGVQSSTISLESKIPNAVLLSSSAVGDISRVGLLEGNYSKNQAVVNTKERPLVDPSVKQVSSAALSGTPIAGDQFTLVVNGTEHTITASATSNILPNFTTLTPQGMRDAMVAKFAADNDQNVEVLAGYTVGEFIIRAKTPGRSFTAATAMVPAAGSTSSKITSVKTVVPNQISPFKALSSDDLKINGIKIRPTNAMDDIYSNQIASSSDPASSAIAMAQAINTHTPETGVRAVANPVVLKGSSTTTGSTQLTTWDAAPNTVKAVNEPVGIQSLYLNGTEIKIEFKKDDTPAERRINLVKAINTYSGTHGILATDNGKGLTLTAQDGRNVSVWYDASIEGLSPASFGLDQGNATSQISKVKLGGTAASGGSVTVNINGTTVTTTPTVTSTSPSAMATLLMTAINAKVSDSITKDADPAKVNGRTYMSNLIAYIDPNDPTAVLIQSKVPGSPFVVLGAKSTDPVQTVSMGEVQANGFGTNQITGVVGATASSSEARTVYGTVRMIAAPANLPALPSTDGKAPNLTGVSGKPISINVGDDGFSAASNFSDLGFSVGSFGGRSSSEMDPPRVGRLAFQVGSSARQMVTIDLADFGKNGPITGEITGDVDKAVENRTVRINTRNGATAVLNLLDEAMDKVNATRATMGAVMNRLDHVINNLTNVSMNMSSSRSQIEDADYASSSTELAKTQIMQQAATAVLAQANTSQQSVLKLLGN
jgi:flagellin